MRGLSGEGWAGASAFVSVLCAAPAVLGLPASGLVRPMDLVRASGSMAYLAANP